MVKRPHWGILPILCLALGFAALGPPAVGVSGFERLTIALVLTAARR